MDDQSLPGPCNAGYRAVNDEKPTGVVIAGGTSPNPRTSGILAYGPLEFLGDSSSKGQVRLYGTHPYTRGGAEHERPARLRRDLDGRSLAAEPGPQAGQAGGKDPGRAPAVLRGRVRLGLGPDCRKLHYSPKWGYYRAVRDGLLTRWISGSAYRMWRQGVSAMIWGQLKDYPITLNDHQGGLFFFGATVRGGQCEGIDAGVPVPLRRLQAQPWCLHLGPAP